MYALDAADGTTEPVSDVSDAFFPYNHVHSSTNLGGQRIDSSPAPVGGVSFESSYVLSVFKITRFWTVFRKVRHLKWKYFLPLTYFLQSIRLNHVLPVRSFFYLGSTSIVLNHLSQLDSGNSCHPAQRAHLSVLLRISRCKQTSWRRLEDLMYITCSGRG